MASKLFIPYNFHTTNSLTFCIKLFCFGLFSLHEVFQILCPLKELENKLCGWIVLKLFASICIVFVSLQANLDLQTNFNMCMFYLCGQMRGFLSKFFSCGRISTSAQLPAGMKNLCVFGANSNQSFKPVVNIMCMSKGLMSCVSNGLQWSSSEIP